MKVLQQETMLVISISHLPPETVEEASDLIQNGDLPGFTRDEGILVPTSARLSDLGPLSFILGYGKAHGFDWVMFDRDGDTLEDLEAFLW